MNRTLPLPPRFGWHAFDVGSALPDGWQLELRSMAAEAAIERDLVPTSVTSREAADVERVAALTVTGSAVSQRAPWLDALYHGWFRSLAECAFAVPVFAAEGSDYGINLNIQREAMRYEAHIDSNPVGALLYVTTHAPGEGGELAVSNRGDITGVAEIERDASRIHPVAGQLVLFEARRYAHYVAPLRKPRAERIVVAMNYYTAVAPESARPRDLSEHLFGIDNEKEALQA